LEYQPHLHRAGHVLDRQPSAELQPWGSGGQRCGDGSLDERHVRLQLRRLFEHRDRVRQE
jgi:hypothetical protein